MDETGLLYRCLPSRSHVTRRDRRHARGTKAMRQKERVTLAIFTHATATHKLPVSTIGQSASPICFRGEGNACTLSYLSEKRDKPVYARWWATIFLPAVRKPHREAKCALLMDNSSKHDVELEEQHVEVIFWPLNTTAVCQPMEAGATSALKRR